MQLDMLAGLGEGERALHERVHLRAVSLASGHAREMHDRRAVVGLEREHLLERRARFGERPPAHGVAVEEHIAQVVPRLDVVRMVGDDPPVESLRPIELASTECLMRLDEEPGAARESLGVPRGAPARAQHGVPRAAGPQRRLAELVVREREGAVVARGALKGRVGRRVSRRAIVRRPLEVGLERGEGGRRRRRETREAVR